MRLLTPPFFGAARTVGNFDTDAQAIIAAMVTPPNAARQNAIISLVQALKIKEIWGLLDTLQVYAGADSQASLLDWRKPTRAAINVGATFTADRGFTGAAAGYVNSNWSPVADAVGYTLDAFSMGYYNRIDGAIDLCDFGYDYASGLDTYMFQRRAGTNFPLIGYNYFGTFGTIPNASALGLSTINKPSANVGEFRRNGAAIETYAVGSWGLQDAKIPVLACDTAGVIGSFASTGRQAALFYAGGYLTIAKELALYNAVQAYMTTVGANV